MTKYPPKKIRCEIYRDSMQNYKRYGIPHNDFSVIRNFQTYIEVVDPKLEDVGVFDNEGSYYSATKDEIDMIKELLVNGVYVNE